MVDLRQLLQALQLADYRFVGLFLSVTLLWLFMRAGVWHTLLEKNYPIKQVFLAINQGYLLNNILPFRLGEVGRAFLLSSKTPNPAKESDRAQIGFFYILSTILIERALDVGLAAGLLLVTLPFVVGASWALQAGLAAAGLVMLGLGSLYLIAQNRPGRSANYHS